MRTVGAERTTGTARAAGRQGGRFRAMARAPFFGLDPTSNAASLVWAAPFLVFFAFPIAGASAYGLEQPLGAALLTLTIAMAVVYVISWLVNPVPPAGRHVTAALLLTNGTLVALQIGMAVVTARMGAGGAASMLAFLASTWTLQSVRPLLYPGLLALLVLAGAQSAISGGESPVYAPVVVAMTGFFCLLARRSMASEVQERLDHHQALALSREAERTRISADLHDILGQTLTGITVKADLAGRLLDAGRAPDARVQIDQLTELSRSALSDVRAVVAATRTLLPGEEIEAARGLLDAAGVTLEVTQTGDPPPGAPSTLAARAIREGVTNAVVHSEPTVVRIRLGTDGVRVTNDGYTDRRAAATAGGGNGLSGLRDQAAALGSVTWGPSGRDWSLDLHWHA